MKFTKNIKNKTSRFKTAGKKPYLRAYLLVLFCFLFLPSFSFDLNGIEDFSSRSLIERQLFGKEEISSENKELLKSKKLSLDTGCLFKEIKKGNYENVELLLKGGLDPNKSYMGEYAIYISAKENNFDILKLLYENGAKLDKGFFSELYTAIKNNNREMAQYLLDRGAKVNYTDCVTYNTVLYMALKNKMYDLASQIIAKGAYADTQSVKYIQKHKLQSLIPDN